MENLTQQEVKENLIKIINLLNPFLNKEMKLEYGNESLYDYGVAAIVGDFSIYYSFGGLCYSYKGLDNFSNILTIDYLLQEFENNGLNDLAIHEFLEENGKKPKRENRLIIVEEFTGIVTYDYESPNEILNVNDKIEHYISKDRVELGGGSKGRSLVSKIIYNYVESTDFLRNILKFKGKDLSDFSGSKLDYLRIIDDFKNSAIEYLDEYEEVVIDMFKDGEFTRMPEKIDYDIFFDLYFDGNVVKDHIYLKGYPQHIE